MKVVHGNVPIKIWVDNIEDVESQALQQMVNVSKLPGIFKWVAGMSDIHLGKGATIGSVIATEGIVAPSAVGVDIGCGVLAYPLGKKIEDIGSLKTIFDTIENTIPLGHKSHEYPKNIGNLKNTASERVQSVWQKAFGQMGTLGAGNHFHETCFDLKGNAWILLHSGSRNVGKEVAEIHIRKAKDLMKLWHIRLDDPDLAYLVEKTPEFDNYMEDLMWCQEYAMLNRLTMLKLSLRALGFEYDHHKVLNCHHNFVARENHYNTNVLITRKGAVRARVGDLAIIPGSMGQKSYIVKGLGNPESFCSCSHGAGRKYSRSKAKEHFTLEDLAEQTEGVICRKDSGVLDEIPGAYKDIDVVMNNQKDLVEIVETLKAVVCVKG